MEIKIKKLHPNAVIPYYVHDGDAAMDVTAVSIEVTEDYVEYDTGLSFELPEDYVMLIFPRSSNSKKDLVLANAVGVLDSNYRGSLKLRFKLQYRASGMQDGKLVTYASSNVPKLDATKWYEVGERVGQIMIIPRPKISFLEVDELTDTNRGDGGFGSTGK